MKTLIVVLAAGLLTWGTARSQYSYDFGAISPAEIQMASCPFDPDADAVIILHDATSNYSDDGELITEHHVRMKILREKGIGYADITIPYIAASDRETVLDVEGMAINYDENGQRREQALDRKSVYSKILSKAWSAKTFSFPSMKAGSIIEYRYKVINRSASAVRNWYFQSELPVMDSRYILYVHPRLQFNYQVFKAPAYDIDVKNDAANAKVSFEMKNIPGLRDEAFMDSREDYLQRVNFQISGFVGQGFTNTKYMSTWDGLAKELLGDSEFGSQLNKNINGTEEFVKATKANTSEIEKMKLVYDYVRGNITWDGSNTWWSPTGVKNAWAKKSGTSGDINLILVNLLRAVDLSANPIMVSERDNGKVNTTYPFRDQFNTVYACVDISGKRYFLDATNRNIPPGIPPSDALNTTGFIVARKDPSLVPISEDGTQFKTNLNILAKVADDGSLSGEGLLQCDGYARFLSLAQYKSNNEKYVDNRFRQLVPTATVTDFGIANEDNDSLPLKNSFKFSIPANKNGDYVLIPYNLFSGYEKNPFIANNRFSTVNFGWKQLVSFTTNIEVSGGLKVDAVPKSIKLVNNDNTISFTRQSFPDDGNHNIVIRTRIEFSKTEYTADEYPNLKEFYKKMFELLNEQVVLKKK